MFFTSDCRQVRDLLWDLASDTVIGSDRERVEAHVARCETCRTELEAYRNTISLMAEFKQDPLPESRLGWRDVERRVIAQGSGSPPVGQKTASNAICDGRGLTCAGDGICDVRYAGQHESGWEFAHA